jgi:hypothetical protein
VARRGVECSARASTIRVILIGVALTSLAVGCGGSTSPAEQAETRGPRPPSATSADAHNFARAWVDATNAGDLESIVNLFEVPARVRISAADPYDELTTKAELRTWVGKTSEQLRTCRHDIRSIAVDGSSVTLVATLMPLSGGCPFEQGREITIAMEIVGGKIRTLG